MGGTRHLWVCERRHPHKIEEARRLHVSHDLGTIDFNRAVSDPEIIGDDLVGLSGNETIKDMALTGRKSSHPV
jgi:hypothetical protein